jgi:hypothetical protein
MRVLLLPHRRCFLGCRWFLGFVRKQKGSRWRKDLPSQSELAGSSEIDCAATEAAKRKMMDANLILKLILSDLGDVLVREAWVESPFLQGRSLGYLYS